MDLSISANVMGVEVKKEQHIDSKNYKYSTDQLPVGNYFLRVQTVDGVANRTFQVLR